MKTLIIFLSAVVYLIIVSFSDYEREEEFENEKSPAPFVNSIDNFSSIYDSKIPLEGPELEKWYFEDWNHPYGNVINGDIMNKIWKQIKSVPSENDYANTDAINSWRLIGPFGSNSTGSGAKFSGRVLDIEVGNTANPVIASASGGLWSYFFLLPVSITEGVTSLACGSFTTHPTDANIIILGTGEPGIRAGTGLWRTTNSGSTWTKIDIGTDPSGFYKIRGQSFIVSTFHAASNSGYYRSSNNGLNWTEYLNGNISDIAVKPSNSSIIYAGKWGDGIYKSTNNGLNWSKVTTPGIPTTNVGRVSLSIGTSNSNKVYASIAKNSDNSMLGVYLSTNDGASWSNISPGENIFGGTNQGWYDNIISVCPTNSNIVLVGGIHLYRSANSGTSWTEIDDDNVHSDQHAMEWTSDGNTVYLGNDGGVTLSTNQGVSFNTTINYLPITQYVNIDIGVSNRGVMFGGSQDNGFTGTTNGGASWLFTKGGDGGGIAVDPHSALYVYGTGGAYSGSYAFKRFRSTDKGLTWDTTNIGIDPSDQWYTKMRSDRTFPIKLYTNSGPYVYRSTNDGDSWTKLNPIPFPVNLRNLNVSKYVSPSAIIYASLSSSTTGQRLRVYDGGNFFERTSGIPTGLAIRGVATHITNTSTAYALINGFSDGEKVFKTTNRGINWTNITGNLPDVPMADLIPHPSNNNNLYLGTQMGCFRTTNAGVSWHRWNNGMHESTIITELKYIDSTVENGKFYIVASTYGSSIWTRDISGDDPLNTLNLTMFIQGFYNPSLNNTVRDTVRINLRNDFSPYSIVDSAKAYLSTSGTATLTFPLSLNTENYYIQIKHRNSIETWSSATDYFEDHLITYDFTNSITKAFGNNMIRVDTSPVEYAVYGGDVNQDGTIDASDLSLIENDAINFLTGYRVTDLNGDNFIDASDAAIADNNASNFVSVERP